MNFGHDFKYIRRAKIINNTFSVTPTIRSINVDDAHPLGPLRPYTKLIEASRFVLLHASVSLA